MWIKLDDGFATHPKVLAAGAIPALIQVRAICYASQHKTDGFIPASAVMLLLSGLDELGIDLGQAGEFGTFGCQANEIEWAPKMVEYGLWEVRPGGYYVHDYLDWNLSKKDYETFIKQKSRAGKKGMKSRWNKGNSDITDVIAPVITGVITKPYHTTSTSTATLSSLNSPNPNPNLQSNGHTHPKGKTAFPLDWICDEKMLSMAAGFGLQGAAEFQAFKDHALMNDRRLHDWMAGYRSWIRKGKAMKEAR